MERATFSICLVSCWSIVLFTTRCYQLTFYLYHLSPELLETGLCEWVEVEEITISDCLDLFRPKIQLRPKIWPSFKKGTSVNDLPLFCNLLSQSVAYSVSFYACFQFVFLPFLFSIWRNCLPLLIQFLFFSPWNLPSSF